MGNTAERVIGLALNRDGSLGVARGAKGFYFDRNLRLQGVAAAGSPGGGVDMDPAENTGRGVAYVSGVDRRAGLAYIDVIDTFTFRSRGRIFMRDPVTGPLRRSRLRRRDPALRGHRPRGGPAGGRASEPGGRRAVTPDLIARARRTPGPRPFSVECAR